MSKVTITVGNVSSRIEAGVLDYETTNMLSEACCYEVQGAEYSSNRRFGRGKFGNWDGRKRLYHKGHRTFPTGLLNRVKEVLINNGFEVEVVRKGENSIVNILLPEIPATWALRDYQDESVEQAIDARRCMIKVATGGGKTVMAGHLIARIGKQTVFLVHTKDLLYQAYDTFVSMFGEQNVGIIGDGRQEIGCPVTVATLQSMSRALELAYKNEEDEGWKDNTSLSEDTILWLNNATKYNCGLVIMDECHRVAAPTATDVVSAFLAAEYRFGMSASPWRDDGADLALEAVFGHVAVNINASWLIENDWLVKPVIKLVNAPPTRFSKGTKYQTIYEEYIVNNAERNELVVRHTKRLVVNQGRATMVLVNRISHGKEISRALTDALGFEVPFISGKDDSELRTFVIKGVRDGSIMCFVASTIADEGLDIRPLAGLVLAGGGKSSTRALQRVGRVLRPFKDKKDAVVIDFIDNAKFLYDHSAARINIYNSESQFVIAEW